MLKDVLYRSVSQKLDVVRVEEHYKVPDGRVQGRGEGVSAAVLLAGCEAGSVTAGDVSGNRQQKTSCIYYTHHLRQLPSLPAFVRRLPQIWVAVSSPGHR